MTAPQMVNDLMKKGVVLSSEDGKLIAEGPKNLLTDDVMADLSKHKARIIPLVKVDWARRAAAILSTVDDPETRTDLRYAFEEFAGRLEYQDNLPRVQAENIACQLLRTLVQQQMDKGNPK